MGKEGQGLQYSGTARSKAQTTKSQGVFRNSHGGVRSQPATSRAAKAVSANGGQGVNGFKDGQLRQFLVTDGICRVKERNEL